jgi:hypothetical protein
VDRLTYQRVADADGIDDEIVVRIWGVDGELVGEADHPTLEDGTTNRLIVAAPGNPVPVQEALANAQALRDELPFRTIFVQIEDVELWQASWGTLLPTKPSALIAKPLP